MSPTAWTQFLLTHARNDRNADIARRIGIDPSNITRWKKDGKTPEPQTAVDFALAYGANPLAALVAAGHLNQESLRSHFATPTDLSEINTPQLLDELQRRLSELRDTFATLERTTETPVIEAAVAALKQHLPTNVSGAPQTEDHIDTISKQEAADMQNYTLAALDAQDPQAEQEAPDTP